MKNILLLVSFVFIKSFVFSQAINPDSIKVFYIDNLKKIKKETLFFKKGTTQNIYYVDKLIQVKYLSISGKLLVELNYDLKGDETGWQKNTMKMVI